MRAGVVGCGLIGRKRAQSLAGARLVACCDLAIERAESLARSVAGAQAFSDWRALVECPDLDIVVVSTTHDALPAIAAGAAAAGKHVLLEKPGARRAAELLPVTEAAARTEGLIATKRTKLSLAAKCR